MVGKELKYWRKMWKQEEFARMSGPKYLSWFGHMKKIINLGVSQRIYRVEVEGARGRRRNKRLWTEVVKELVGKGGLEF